MIKYNDRGYLKRKNGYFGLQVCAIVHHGEEVLWQDLVAAGPISKSRSKEINCSAQLAFSFCSPGPKPRE